MERAMTILVLVMVLLLSLVVMYLQKTLNETVEELERIEARTYLLKKKVELQEQSQLEILKPTIKRTTKTKMT